MPTSFFIILCILTKKHERGDESSQNRMKTVEKHCANLIRHVDAVSAHNRSFSSSNHCVFGPNKIQEKLHIFMFFLDFHIVVRGREKEL